LALLSRCGSFSIDIDTTAENGDDAGMPYPGGKNGAGVYQTLINLMPPHDVYIEPFLGGGAVMRLKRPARLNIGIDLDPASLALAVPAIGNGTNSPARRGESGDIDAAVLAMSAARAGNGGKRSPSPLGKNGGSTTPSNQAIAAGNAGMGDAGSGIQCRKARLDGCGGLQRSERAFLSLPRSPLVKNAGAAASSGLAMGPGPEFHFRCGDGIEFLASYPYTGAELVYCDPPYMMSTRSGKRLYACELADVDHLRLLRVLRELPCLVMVSGYSSPLYARELKTWHAASFQTTTRGGRPVAEWVWYNYERPLRLHDYRFLGSDFRERERIKRKKARWLNRLAVMPALERQALLSAIDETAGSGLAQTGDTAGSSASSGDSTRSKKPFPGPLGSR
jgi:hypothetical protein